MTRLLTLRQRSTGVRLVIDVDDTTDRTVTGHVTIESPTGRRRRLRGRTDLAGMMETVAAVRGCVDDWDELEDEA